jgi:MHS family proline/betaine transporter-like MFS transporter
VKSRFYIFFGVVLLTPLLLKGITSPEQLFFLQVLTIVFASDGMPAVPVFLIHFPIFKRFTYVSFMYALSRALIYVVTSFGLVYLMATFGNWGIWILMVPLSLAFYWGIRHYEKLEFAGDEFRRVNV